MTKALTKKQKAINKKKAAAKKTPAKKVTKAAVAPVTQKEAEEFQKDAPEVKSGFQRTYRSRFDLSTTIKIKGVKSVLFFPNCTFVVNIYSAKAYNCTPQELSAAIEATGTFAMKDIMCVGGTGVKVSEAAKLLDERAAKLVKHKLIKGMRASGAKS